jgi:hypothetical protein
MLIKQSEPVMPTQCLFPTRVFFIETEDRDEHILTSHKHKAISNAIHTTDFKSDRQIARTFLNCFLSWYYKKMCD